MRTDGKTGKRINHVKKLRVGGRIEYSPNHFATITAITGTMTGFRIDLRVTADWKTTIYTDSKGMIFERPQPMLVEVANAQTP